MVCMFSSLTFFATAIADVEDSEETKSSAVNTQLIPKSFEVRCYLPVKSRLFLIDLIFFRIVFKYDSTSFGSLISL